MYKSDLASNNLEWLICHRLLLITEVDGDTKVPVSMATTSRCRGGHDSFPWIAPLYP